VRKLTFERAVLIVFILIILISTSEITGRYIAKVVKKSPVTLGNGESGPNLGFSTVLMAADNLYKLGDYEGAAKEYFELTLNNTLTFEQKIHANFRLGVCQYNMKNYDLAVDSFDKVVAMNPNDSVACNNAAVSAYRANNMKKAIELQQKALTILPAVEYYYNLARMYEDSEEYQLAAENFLVVAKGEQNITKAERIDPVRVMEKVVRLQPKQQESMTDSANKILIALRLKDDRDVFIMNENEMKLKQGEFLVNVENVKGAKNIVGQYDRDNYDPYGLISELIWTVYKDGKQISKRIGDKIVVSAKESGSYEVKLHVKYNGNKEMISTKTVTIKEYLSTIDDGTKEEVIVKNPVKRDTKTYIYSIYEQLFEDDFNIITSGYTDNYNAVWGKDNFIEASFNKTLAVDKSSSLLVKNRNKKDAGLWVNLDSLLEKDDLKGKQVSISFFARKVTDNANLDVSVRVKSNNMIATTPESFSIPYQFEQQRMVVYIPEDATGFTVSIKTSPGEQFNIDGFTIVD